MKTMSLPVFLLLLASTMTLFPDAVRALGNPVLDERGLGLVPGVPYYIRTSEWPLGGGVVSLAKGKGKNDTCPVDVILLENFCEKGYPVTLAIASGEGFFITDSTDVYISFDTTSNCTNASMLWKHGDNATSTEFLIIGGVEGDVDTLFRIIAVGFNYKLVAYKFAYNGRQLLSTSDVGIEFNFTTGLRRLALTEPPLLVNFELALDHSGLKAVV